MRNNSHLDVGPKYLVNVNEHFCGPKPSINLTIMKIKKLRFIYKDRLIVF